MVDSQVNYSFQELYDILLHEEREEREMHEKMLQLLEKGFDDNLCDELKNVVEDWTQLSIYDNPSVLLNNLPAVAAKLPSVDMMLSRSNPVIPTPQTFKPESLPESMDASHLNRQFGNSVKFGHTPKKIHGINSNNNNNVNNNVNNNNDNNNNINNNNNNENNDIGSIDKSNVEKKNIKERVLSDRGRSVLMGGLATGIIQGSLSVQSNYARYKDKEISAIQLLKETLKDTASGSWEGVKWGSVMTSSSIAEGAFIGIMADGTKQLILNITKKGKISAADVKSSLESVAVEGLKAGGITLIVKCVGKPNVAGAFLAFDLLSLLKRYAFGAISKRDLVIEITKRCVTTSNVVGGAIVGSAVGTVIAGPLGGIVGGISGSILGGISSGVFSCTVAEFVAWLFGLEDPISKAYSLFGLNHRCTDRELNIAYHRLALINSPDKHPNPNDKLKQTVIMQNINVAVELLRLHREARRKEV